MSQKTFITEKNDPNFVNCNLHYIMLNKEKGSFSKRDAPWYRSQAYQRKSSTGLYQDLKRKEMKNRLSMQMQWSPSGREDEPKTSIKSKQSLKIDER